jgi:SARP family transcriptional regulator, regulator of embCAB operon
VEQMSAGHAMPISVKIIGNLQVRRGDTVLSAASLGGPKPRQIFEILLLNLGTPVSKDRLIELLWGGRAPGEALATLESYVSVLRRNLQPGCSKTGPLRTANGGYLLEQSLVELDLDRFNMLMLQAEHCGPTEAYPLLVEALDLASGPLLSDELAPEWAEEAREVHAANVTAVQVMAAEAAEAGGEADRSVHWSQLAVAAEPLNERAWSALVSGYEAAGRYSEGLQAYDKCRRLLDRDLGCAPGPALRAAHARLLQATAASDGELSEVLEALLYLNDRLHSQPVQSTRPAIATRSRTFPAGPGHERAGRVISTFLNRALANA